MSRFQTILRRVRRAVRYGAAPGAKRRQVLDTVTFQLVEATQSELESTFVRELEAVSGHVLRFSSTQEAFASIASLVRDVEAKMVAIGEGITVDFSGLESSLENCAALRVATLAQSDHRSALSMLAGCEVGVVEADYAIASTGTLALLAAPTRPRSLSLLAPVSVILVRGERILPDLASVINAIGAEAIASRPLTLVTGPSRTADIEKRIVLGVHGPRQLHVVLLSPHAVEPPRAAIR